MYEMMQHVLKGETYLFCLESEISSYRKQLEKELHDKGDNLWYQIITDDRFLRVTSFRNMGVDKVRVYSCDKRIMTSNNVYKMEL